MAQNSTKATTNRPAKRKRCPASLKTFILTKFPWGGRIDGSLSASCDPDHSRVKIRDFRAQLYVSQITICCDGWTKTVEWDFCVRTFQEAEDATSLTGRSQGWLE